MILINLNILISLIILILIVPRGSGMSLRRWEWPLGKGWGVSLGEKGGVPREGSVCVPRGEGVWSLGEGGGWVPRRRGVSLGVRESP